MKKSHLKLFFSSLFTVGLVGTSVGATFALFTDTAETKVEVRSGKLDVSAEIKNLLTYSCEANEDGDRIDEHDKKYISKQTAVQGVFTNGGTATLSGDESESSTLTLERITPGDRVVFDLSLGNESTVDIQYRIFYRAVGENMDLVKGLTTKINLGNSTHTYEGLTKYESEWTLASPTDALVAVSFDIELPIAKGNIYQSRSASYLIGIEAVQGNADVPTGETVQTTSEGA